MDAKEVSRQYAEALDRGDIDGMAALVSDDFRFGGAGLDRIGNTHCRLESESRLAFKHHKRAQEAQRRYDEEREGVSS